MSFGARSIERPKITLRVNVPQERLNRFLLVGVVRVSTFTRIVVGNGLGPIDFRGVHGGWRQVDLLYRSQTFNGRIRVVRRKDAPEHPSRLLP